MQRLCVRPGCGQQASATLTYDYAARTVFLSGLGAEREPSAYDLCPRHADRLGVPQGWRADDRRVAAPTALLDRRLAS